MLDGDDAEIKGKLNSNNMSLRLSAEAAVKLLEQMSTEGKFNIHYNLFFLLGCLPDGITKEHMIQLWNNYGRSEVEKSIQVLEKMNFLEPGVDKITLNAFLMNFVQETIDDESRSRLMHIIADFYGQRLGDVYKINAAVDYDLKKLFGSRKEDSQSIETPSYSWLNNSNDGMSMFKLKNAVRD